MDWLRNDDAPELGEDWFKRAASARPAPPPDSPWPATAEYAFVTSSGAPTAQRIRFDRRWSERVRAEVEIAAVTEGYAIAGSAMRWDAAHISVRWSSDGAWNGKRFRPNEVELARSFFRKLTKHDPRLRLK